MPHSCLHIPTDAASQAVLLGILETLFGWDQDTPHATHAATIPPLKAAPAPFDKIRLET